MVAPKNTHEFDDEAEPLTGRATKAPGPNSTFADRAKASGRNKRVDASESK